ncbi:MAG: hypothetical protein ACXV7G_10675 [Halobacteriota archaeon]
MHIEELLEKLANIGVNISRKTLRRWADQSLISNHAPKKFYKGRGHAETWPPEAFEEAAAVWAVTRAAKKRLSRNKIKEISIAAQQVFRTPQADYEWSRDVALSGPNSSMQYGYRVLKMQFDEDAFSLFDNLVQLRKYSRHLKPLLDYGPPSALLDNEEIASYLDEFMLLRKDGRLSALLDNEEIAAAVDRLILDRSEDCTLILLRLADILIRSPEVFKLAKTWAATVIKARYHMPIIQPAKIVFHWRSRLSITQNAKWLELYKITLEDPDPISAVFADYDGEFVSPKEERNDEDEIVIFFDGIDVRKKVFYAPFEPFEEWYELKQMEQ